MNTSEAYYLDTCQSLQKLSDEQLVQKIKNNESCDDCIKELSERNKGILYTMARSYACPSSGSYYYDLIDSGVSNIYEAALSYDPSKKTKFSSFYGLYLKWKCLSEHKRAIKEKIGFDSICDNIYTVKGIEHIIEKSGCFNPDECDNLSEQIINFAINEAPKDQISSDIMKLRYLDGMAYRDISKTVGLSHEWARNLHDKVIESTKQYFLS